MRNLQNRYKNQRGFNLIELMIVIAIIGLLIGVGSVAWGAMVKSGNEAAAAQSIRQIQTIQTSYAGKNRGKFASFDELVRIAGLDEKFKGDRPVVNGYIFTMLVEEATPTKPASYILNADPQVGEGVSATGNRHFFTDSTIGTIKATDENRPAKAEDPSI